MMEDYTRIAKRLQPLYPTGAGKGLRSTSVKLLVQGSKCKLKCKANTYRSQNNEVVKHYDDSVSCKHLVASLIGLFNRLGWDSDEVLDLILGSDTFQAFEWLRSLDEPEEMFRNIWQDSYTSAEVTKFNKQTREDEGKKPKNMKTIFRYSVWLDILGYIERHPGQSVRFYKEKLPYRGGMVQDYLQEARKRGYVIDTGKRSKNGKILKSELTVVFYPPEPRITRPSWNQPKAQRAYWEKVHSIPKLHAQDDETLVEWYESGALDRLIAAWDREHNASTAVKAPVSHSETLNTASGTRAHLDDFKSLESHTANATEEEILDIIRVMNLC